MLQELLKEKTALVKKVENESMYFEAIKIKFNHVYALIAFIKMILEYKN